WYFLAVTANTILFSIIAMLLAMCLSQLGGYMHDAAHMMILKTYFYFPLTFLLAYSFQFKNNIEYFIREVKTGFRLSILGEMSLHFGGFFLWYVLPFLVFDLL